MTPTDSDQQRNVPAPICGHELEHGGNLRTCRYLAGHRDWAGVDGKPLLPMHSDGAVVWGHPAGIGHLPDGVEQQPRAKR
jgi:hypothetical protein